MVIIAVFVILFLLFFALHRHSGPAHLAMISGLTVSTMFGTGCVEWLGQVFTWLDYDLAYHILYVLLILVCPLIIFLHSSKGGMSGILRVAESVLFALLMTALLVPSLEYFFSFDDFSAQLATATLHAEGVLIAIGVATAYIDILFLGIQRGE